MSKKIKKKEVVEEAEEVKEETGLPNDYSLAKGDYFVPYDEEQGESPDLDQYFVSSDGKEPIEADQAAPFEAGKTRWHDIAKHRVMTFMGNDSDGNPKWEETVAAPRYVILLEETKTLVEGTYLGEICNKRKVRNVEIATKTAEKLAELEPTDHPTIDDILEELAG